MLQKLWTGLQELQCVPEKCGDLPFAGYNGLQAVVCPDGVLMHASDSLQCSYTPVIHCCCLYMLSGEELFLQHWNFIHITTLVLYAEIFHMSQTLIL